MNRFSLAAVAAAAVMIVLVAGLLIARPGSSVGNTPSQAATPPASSSGSPPSSAAAAVPPKLLFDWFGAPRDVQGVSGVDGLDLSRQTVLSFATDTLRVTGAADVPSALQSTIRISGDQFEVTGKTADGCNHAIGRYGWALSPGATRLTVTSDVDPCAPRSATLVGTWYRAACKDQGNRCWGDLEAGTYPTRVFGPRLDPSLPPRIDFGALSFTVPDGWSISSDHTSDIRLLRSSDYAREDASGPSASTPDIEAWIRPAGNVQGEGCTTAIAPGVGRTPKALVDWVAGLPALDASAPTTVTIDGHAGRSTDVGIAPSWTGTCPGWSQPTVPLFTEGAGSAGSVGDGPYQVGLSGQQKNRLIVLDLGGGRVVLILVSAPDQASMDAFLPEAMPIIQSFHFQ